MKNKFIKKNKAEKKQSIKNIKLKNIPVNIWNGDKTSCKKQNMEHGKTVKYRPMKIKNSKNRTIKKESCEKIVQEKTKQ